MSHRTRSQLAILGVTSALVAFAFAPPAAAQVAIGIRGGVNFADVTSEQFEFGRPGGRRAFTGGGFLNISGTARYSLQLELLYSQKGISILGLGGSAVANVDYIDIPILLRVRLRDDHDRVRPYLFGGGFLSFETSCSAVGTISTLASDDDCGNLLPGRGETDAGLVVGSGLEYGLANRWFLTLDGRLDVGVLNLNWADEDDSVRSRVWAISGGIGVLLGA
ncbi:MAG: PorT family protein [Gemmatimonadetes bacterium]|nr:PorT family protein [Gemmatimonadota bacterium]